MRTRIAPRAVGAVAALSLLALTGAPAAQAAAGTAAPVKASAPSGESSAAKCYHHRAKIKLAKRAGLGKNHKFTGWVKKNARVCINRIESGGTYKECGGDNRWGHIAGTRSWVAAVCLRWDE